MKDIEKRVLRIIGEDPDSPDVYTSAKITPIRDSINDAIEELSTVTETNVRKYTIPLIGGVNFYRMNFVWDQFCYVTRAWLPDIGRELDQVSYTTVERFDYRWLETNNTPTVYMPIGVKYIGFYPIYGGDGHSVELSCAILPARYSADTTRLKIKEDFEDGCVAYACMEHFAKYDVMKAYSYRKRYAEVLSKYGTHITSKDRKYKLNNYTSSRPRPLHGYV